MGVIGWEGALEDERFDAGENTLHVFVEEVGVKADGVGEGGEFGGESGDGEWGMVVGDDEIFESSVVVDEGIVEAGDGRS